MYSLYGRSDDFQNIPVIDLTSTILMLLIISPHNFFLSLLNVLIRKSIKEESLTKIRLTKSLLHERYAWQEVLMGSPQNDLLTSQWNSLNFFFFFNPTTLNARCVSYSNKGHGKVHVHVSMMMLFTNLIHQRFIRSDGSTGYSV